MSDAAQDLGRIGLGLQKRVLWREICWTEQEASYIPDHLVVLIIWMGHDVNVSHFRAPTAAELSDAMFFIFLLFCAPFHFWKPGRSRLAPDFVLGLYK